MNYFIRNSRETYPVSQEGADAALRSAPFLITEFDGENFTLRFDLESIPLGARCKVEGFDVPGRVLYGPNELDEYLIDLIEDEVLAPVTEILLNA